MYATVPEDTTTAVFINVHTSQEKGDIQIDYDTQEYYNENKKFRNMVQPTKFEFNVETRGNRNVWSALIQNLTPDTAYSVGVFYDNIYQAVKVYKTLPDKLPPAGSPEFIMANGGDTGATKTARAITNNLIPYSPRIILVG